MEMNSKELIQRMEATLNNIGYDLQRAINELGQVSRSERRVRWTPLSRHGF